MYCAAGSRFQISPEGFCLVGVLFGPLQLMLSLCFGLRPCGHSAVCLSVSQKHLCLWPPDTWEQQRTWKYGLPWCFNLLPLWRKKKNNRPVLVDEKMLVPLAGSLFSELLWTQAPLTLHIHTVTFRGSDESEISAVNSSFHFCE